MTQESWNDSIALAESLKIEELHFIFDFDDSLEWFIELFTSTGLRGRAWHKNPLIGFNNAILDIQRKVKL